MSTVLAKFRLDSCESQRDAEYTRDPETGRYEAISAGETVRVRLAPVQGEPFGKYTPSGSLDMTIRNSAAARHFSEPWQRFVHDPDPKAKAPEFYLVFAEDTGRGAPSVTPATV